MTVYIYFCTSATVPVPGSAIGQLPSANKT